MMTQKVQYVKMDILITVKRKPTALSPNSICLEIYPNLTLILDTKTSSLHAHKCKLHEKPHQMVIKLELHKNKVPSKQSNVGKSRLDCQTPKFSEKRKLVSELAFTPLLGLLQQFTIVKVKATRKIQLKQNNSTTGVVHQFTMMSHGTNFYRLNLGIEISKYFCSCYCYAYPMQTLLFPKKTANQNFEALSIQNSQHHISVVLIKIQRYSTNYGCVAVPQQLNN